MTMTSDKPLSEKVCKPIRWNDMLIAEDVAEDGKRLKWSLCHEILATTRKESELDRIPQKQIIETIDEIFGEFKDG